MTIQTPRGTRDLIPEEMEKRNWIISTIRDVYEKYGFMGLETPAFESWELLSKKGGGGDAIKDEIYYFKDKSGRELGLRFDLTVPLSRFIASNPQLPKPFKRCQLGKVWRYDRPQFGRWREFEQIDIDIIGSSNMEADAECLAAVSETLTKLGVKFTIRVNNRKILNSIVEELGMGKKSKEIYRILDKMEKISETETLKSLKKIDKKTTKILSIIKNGFSKISNDLEGVQELNELVKACKRYGIKVKPDLSLVRGLDYYTGSIFEVDAGGNIGSIAGGGRYDNLIETMGGQSTPAVGISIGIDRLSDILKSKYKKKSKIFVAIINNELRNDGIRLTKSLRNSGLNVVIDVSGKGLRKQLDYANSADIKWTIFVGEREVRAKLYTLRDMKSGKEQKMTQRDLIKKLKKDQLENN